MKLFSALGIKNEWDEDFSVFQWLNDKIKVSDI